MNQSKRSMPPGLIRYQEEQRKLKQEQEKEQEKEQEDELPKERKVQIKRKQIQRRKQLNQEMDSDVLRIKLQEFQLELFMLNERQKEVKRLISKLNSALSQ
jgi:hypothetical protein